MRDFVPKNQDLKIRSISEEKKRVSVFYFGRTPKIEFRFLSNYGARKLLLYPYLLLERVALVEAKDEDGGIPLHDACAGVYDYQWNWIIHASILKEGYKC
ncbi:hypothetical protein L2E82_48929 [Cichorium intybus]|uniref:Uncharacterized protein n=1 Tax=Cichorium intybus TaxID=13427 RepID=A0ACB8YYW8_CICIN|nr:hypothetical protein L2E82_48929 [Cichorium intybus]